MALPPCLALFAAKYLIALGHGANVAGRGAGIPRPVLQLARGFPNLSTFVAGRPASHRRPDVVAAGANPERDIFRVGAAQRARRRFCIWKDGNGKDHRNRHRSPGADLRRCAAPARPFRGDARPGRCPYPDRRRHRAQHSDRVGGHGYGDRIATGDRHGAGRRHRRHPPQFFADRAGRASQASEEIRTR
jgi:hypothetical protein